MEPQLVRLSKFLSLVLRHNPGKIGLTLDTHGWIEVDGLLEAAQRHGVRLDQQTLLRIVAANDEQRFALSEDGRWLPFHGGDRDRHRVSAAAALFAHRQSVCRFCQRLFLQRSTGHVPGMQWPGP
jgi:RNA 2'-phosphotransferase, Tpt1 / KptA family